MKQYIEKVTKTHEIKGYIVSKSRIFLPTGVAWWIVAAHAKLQ